MYVIIMTVLFLHIALCSIPKWLFGFVKQLLRVITQLKGKGTSCIVSLTSTFLRLSLPSGKLHIYMYPNLVVPIVTGKLRVVYFEAGPLQKSSQFLKPFTPTLFNKRITGDFFNIQR